MSRKYDAGYLIFIASLLCGPQGFIFDICESKVGTQVLFRSSEGNGTQIGSFYLADRNLK